MECSSCFKKFSEEHVVPLTCQCGKTLCRDCIQTQVQDDKYCCSLCHRTTMMKDMYINRGVSDIVGIIQQIENEKTTKGINIKRKYILGQGKDANVGGMGEKAESGEDGGLVDKEVEAIVKIKSDRVQTAKSYMVSEKFTNREFEMKISWKHCFMVPVYFLAQSPWVILPIFSYNQRQAQMT